MLTFVTSEAINRVAICLDLVYTDETFCSLRSNAVSGIQLLLNRLPKPQTKLTRNSPHRS